MLCLVVSLGVWDAIVVEDCEDLEGWVWEVVDWFNEIVVVVREEDLDSGSEFKMVDWFNEFVVVVREEVLDSGS